MASEVKRNFGWRIFAACIPVTGALVGVFTANFIAFIYAGRTDEASGILWLIGISFLTFFFSVLVGNLPSPIKWSLPEAVSYLAYGNPVLRNDWPSLVSAKTGWVTTTFEVDPHDGSAIRRTKSGYDQHSQSAFDKRVTEATEELLEAARAGKVSAYAYDEESGSIMDLSEPNWMSVYDMRPYAHKILMLKNPLAPPQPNNSRALRNVVFYRDEVLALRNFLRPLAPPIDQKALLGDGFWAGFYERSERQSAQIRADKEQKAHGPKPNAE